MSPDLEVVATFLSRLYTSWTLTAIIPDGKTITRSFSSMDEALTFIAAHNSDKNIYYTLNVAKSGLTKKPSKSDILEAQWVHADLDPNEDESPEAAKSRYVTKLNAFKYKPTLIIDSGNGIQVLWHITGVGPERFAQVEAVSKWIMEELGSKAGTQNVDRILRLPGTINHPNAVKLRAGRVACMSLCLTYNELVSYDLDDFELPVVESPQIAPDETHIFDNDVLWWTIKTGGNYQEVGRRSEGVWWCINEMYRRGYCTIKIKATMSDRSNLITRHIYDQPGAMNYLDAQLARARAGLKLAIDDRTRKPFNVRYNLRIALMKLGVAVRYNEFNDRTMITGLDDFGPYLTDEAVLHIRMTCDHVFKFYPAKEMSFEVIFESAQLNKYHPVKDYFASLKWDGVERLDNWMITYGGAGETPYVRAVGALLLTAAVRRVRVPGAKFDEIVVIESPLQGTNKSSALETLASTEWFSDYLPINLQGKAIIEAIQGCLIIEAAELSGMRRAEIEHMKAFTSRTVDRGRMSYDRVITNIPRQCVFVGTTNDSQYLKDTGGNRRFWPVRIKEFNLETLRRDRDQLWAEAVVREASGASIRMEPELWEAAAQEQLKRAVPDPFYDELQHHIGKFNCAKITSETLRLILDVRIGSWTQDQNQRLVKAMRELGWKRPNTAGTIFYEGRYVVGWVIGDVEAKDRPLISAFRDRESGMLIVSIEGGLDRPSENI